MATKISVAAQNAAAEAVGALLGVPAKPTYPAAG